MSEPNNREKEIFNEALEMDSQEARLGYVKGGCGVVYMAEQEKPVRRRVALKVIKLGMDTKQVVARFEAEPQALAMMDHPNIAKVLEAGATDTGRPYFVMELVRGIKITEFCDQKKLSTRERLDLFMQVPEQMDLQRRFDFIGTQLTRILVLARAGEGDAARTALAGLWPEVEAVFKAGPEHRFNQVQMARALSVKAEVDSLDVAARQVLLARAIGYLWPASAAGRLTRYERDVLLAGMEKKLAQ